MDGLVREHVRRRIDEVRRRQVGHNLGANGDADLRASGNSGKQALAVASWEAAGGDPLAALSLALDELARRAG